MPISTLDPRALRQLTPAQVADLALSADQERRRLARMGDHTGAAHYQAEADRLADYFAAA